MIQQIVLGYRTLLKSALSVVALLAFCVLLAAALVYPLWFFATTYPARYSAVIGGIVLFATLAFIAHPIITAKTGEDRKRVILRYVLRLLKALVIVAGLSIVISCVSTGQTGIAIVVILLMLILYGILAYGTKKRSSH